MSYQQIAKLYLRGRRIKRLKELPPEEINKIEKIIDLVVQDPNLIHCQKEFCNALARTIRNEYSDTDVGLQDFRIAVMRAAIEAHDDPNVSQTVTDPVQRKKWFQTWVFNYLRQILRENKIPVIKKDKISQISLEEFVTNKILKEINDKNSILEKIENGFSIHTNTLLLPLDIVKNIFEMNNKYLNQLKIQISGDNIMIIRTCEEVKVQSHNVITTSIKEHSFDVEDETKRDSVEVEAGRHNPRTEGVSMEVNETFQKLRERIPQTAQPILEIYIEDSRPDQYVEKFGSGSPKIAHIAQFLGMSVREVKKLVALIRIQMTILNLGY